MKQSPHKNICTLSTTFPVMKDHRFFALNEQRSKDSKGPNTVLITYILPDNSFEINLLKIIRPNNAEGFSCSHWIRSFYWRAELSPHTDSMLSIMNFPIHFPTSDLLLLYNVWLVWEEQFCRSRSVLVLVLWTWLCYNLEPNTSFRFSTVSTKTPCSNYWLIYLNLIYLQLANR